MHPSLLPSSGAPDLVSAWPLREWPPSPSELRRHNLLLSNEYCMHNMLVSDISTWGTICLQQTNNENKIKHFLKKECIASRTILTVRQSPCSGVQYLVSSIVVSWCSLGTSCKDLLCGTGHFVGCFSERIWHENSISELFQSRLNH